MLVISAIYALVAFTPISGAFKSGDTGAARKKNLLSQNLRQNSKFQRLSIMPVMGKQILNFIILQME